MHALNNLLQFLLVLAVACYFTGFVAPSPLRWRLWRWAALLVALVFLIAAVIVEANAHPLAAVCILCGASLMAYSILQVRRDHRERAHRRSAPTPFLNLRVTGKTVVDLDHDQHAAEHLAAEHEEHE
jgi:hypothetical protein